MSGQTLVTRHLDAAKHQRATDREAVRVVASPTLDIFGELP